MTTTIQRRIPASFIDEVLTRTEITAIIEQYIPLKKAGINYQALCPFHNEKSPSFSVNPNKQFYYCFGCGASGNAISFLMEYERMPFMEALEQLTHRAGMTLPETSNHQQASQNDELYAVLQKAVVFYQQQLSQHSEGKKAQAYLQQRGLNEDVIQHFQLGFAPPGWDHLMKQLAQSPRSAEHLTTTGMLIQNDNGRVYDRFRNRIMFPIRDRRGRVIAFGGRVMNDETPKYLNSPETPVFHKSHELFGLYEARLPRRPLDRLLVVEGYMDVIALAQHGIDFAVATLGTAVTEHHLQRLFRTTKQVVFCFDGDAAGAKAAWKSAELSLKQINDHIQVHFLFLPKAEDPDSLVQKEGQARFLERLDQSSSLGHFFLEHLSEETNLETIDGRAKLVSLAIPYLKAINAPITQTLIIDALAELSRTSAEKIQQWLDTGHSNEVAPSRPQNNVSQKQQQTPVRLAVTLLLQHPELAKQIDADLPNTDIAGLSLLKQLIDLLQENPALSTGAILEHWRDSKEHTFLKKLAVDTLAMPQKAHLNELQNSLKRLHSHPAEQQIATLISKARTQGLTEEEKNTLNTLLKQKKTGFKRDIPL